tara:strand:+ start:314 stop:616 length:303 start_codon:yes stop_codon:yes gene_type:complete
MIKLKDLIIEGSIEKAVDKAIAKTKGLKKDKKTLLHIVNDSKSSGQDVIDFATRGGNVTSSQYQTLVSGKQIGALRRNKDSASKIKVLNSVTTMIAKNKK